MSKLTLAAALAALDAGIDGHWTEEGSPRLDILTTLTGTKVTREQVTAAAPGLTRMAREAAKAAPQAVAGVGEGTTATAAPAAPQAPAQGANDGTQYANTDGAAEPGTGNEDGQAPVEDELTLAQRRVDRLLAQKAEVDRDLAQESAALDRLIEARDKAAPRQALDSAVRAYHATQLKDREERARRIAAMRGVDLQSILPSHAPLDQALKSRPRNR